MSRQSIESISIAAVSIPTRPDPPSELTTEQARVWRDVVSTKPPEWFESDCFPMLKAYCRASDNHEQLSRRIQKTDIQHSDSSELKKLLSMQDEQARQIANLATKMRLTQQSRYTPKAASTANKKAASGAKPWD